MLGMFDTIKAYGVAILTALGMIFITWFKLRGNKIDDLNEQIDTMEANDKAEDYEADNRVAKAKAEADDVEDITIGTHTI